MDVAAWLAGLGLGATRRRSATTRSTPSVLPDLTADDLGSSASPRRPPAQAARRDRRASRRRPRRPRHTGRGSSPACRPGRWRPAPRGRAAPAHGDVRRPGRLDRALGPARSGGDGRGPARLPGRGRGRDRALRGPRRQVHGRRRAGLLRLAQGARGRRRAGGPRRARRPRGGGPAGTPERRPLAARVGIATGLVVVGDLIGRGRGPGGGRGRRDAEPRRPPAGARRAGRGGRRRGDAAAARHPLRVRRPRPGRGQGLRRARARPSA